MKKWRICLLLWIVFAAFCMTACNDIYSEDVITDRDRYADIWEYSERRVTIAEHDGEPLALFPKDISDLNVVDFYGWHVLFRYTASGFQIHLAVQYSAEEYLNEKQRLADTEVLNRVKYDTENLSAPAYVAVWNWNCCYEYAICHDDSNTVDYVFLQLVNPPNIKLDDSLLPKDYKELYYSKDDSFSIYD